MSSQPTGPSTDIDPETEKIILERLETADKEPKVDAREAIAEIRRHLKQSARR